MSDLKKIGPATYELARTGEMRVPGLIIASEELLSDPAIEKPLDQVRNVAHLPGIVGYSIAMPDIHWGYGFPIGGVAAMDAESGVISPGGVGYDINCGVRLAIAPEQYQNLSAHTRGELIREIFARIPSGVGKGRRDPLQEEDYLQLVAKGARWLVEQGHGFDEDLEHMESRGVIAGGVLDACSSLAKQRGQKQLGSIGSGNHFVEIGQVQTIYLPDIAKEWGIHEGQIYILIHSGSRGFGHQVCQDTIDAFIKKGFARGLPDTQLVAAPIQSPEGKRYFEAMAAAANFAFCNRQEILHAVRAAFNKVCGYSQRDIRLIYDVCHNIAKFEEHGSQRLCVHRKGATRAYGPDHPELAPIFRKTGQPVLVPGDMGRASHLMVGCGNLLTWCSSCHGAGRARSRVQSLKSWKGVDLIKHMHERGVTVLANSSQTIAEEMPDAYKDVDKVVQAVQEAGLAKMVARLQPHLVAKG